mmetsp:Transcript_25899/g.71305  ORF Transcript_25899/g.71305 Transcript_25899/m.71305 type:complete len:316 (+) Transcript_25899:104-1051(+)
MTDHAEEQEMEAEALAAIFDHHFVVLEPNEEGRPQWTVDIYPETASDETELQELNHVAIQLHITLPETYPDDEPAVRVDIVKGLVEDPHGQELQQMANEEATANQGVPSIFAIAERLREWLAENNRPGMDDISMHAQMMRKQREKEQQEKKAAQDFEAQTAQEEMTAAEMEELAVRKRRAEGTPCTMEHFEAWKLQFEQEMAEAEEARQEELGGTDDKKKGKKDAANEAAVASRMTGFEFFSSKGNNLEALEAAAERAGEQEMEDEEAAEEGDDGADENGDGLKDVNEDLFDDDVDLDDLDFDDDDDDDDEELDI